MDRVQMMFFALTPERRGPLLVHALPSVRKCIARIGLALAVAALMSCIIACLVGHCNIVDVTGIIYLLAGSWISAFFFIPFCVGIFCFPVWATLAGPLQARIVAILMEGFGYFALLASGVLAIVMPWMNIYAG